MSSKPNTTMQVFRMGGGSCCSPNAKKRKADLTSPNSPPASPPQQSNDRLVALNLLADRLTALEHSAHDNGKLVATELEEIKIALAGIQCALEQIANKV